MSLVNVSANLPPDRSPLARFLDGFSIEVMPRTAAAIDHFGALFPAGTRVYIAHLDGTEFPEMLATAKRLRAQGCEPMPHFPARLIANASQLHDWVARYRGEADVRQALLIGGGVKAAKGAYHSTMQLLDSGAFAGFERLHVAGHPEGNRDIDPSGGERVLMQALALKQAWRERSDAQMAIVTQFCFEAAPLIAWAERLAASGIHLPVHVGAAGPAKLQTLVKFAIACGVGPSLRVLQKRARDVTKLLLPFEPTEMLSALASHKAANATSSIESVHFFPLGGIYASSAWLADHNKGAET